MKFRRKSDRKNQKGGENNTCKIRITDENPNANDRRINNANEKTKFESEENAGIRYIRIGIEKGVTNRQTLYKYRHSKMQ